MLELTYSAEKLFLAEGAVVQLGDKPDFTLEVIEKNRPCRQEMCRTWCDKVSDLLSSQKY
ncbi:hypothetical protein ACVBEJ_12155 [Porticoccus sp. GXU_MW_L64]